MDRSVMLNVREPARTVWIKSRSEEPCLLSDCIVSLHCAEFWVCRKRTCIRSISMPKAVAICVLGFRWRRRANKEAALRTNDNFAIRHSAPRELVLAANLCKPWDHEVAIAKSLLWAPEGEADQCRYELLTPKTHGPRNSRSDHAPGRYLETRTLLPFTLMGKHI